MSYIRTKNSKNYINLLYFFSSREQSSGLKTSTNSLSSKEAISLFNLLKNTFKSSIKEQYIENDTSFAESYPGRLTLISPLFASRPQR